MGSCFSLGPRMGSEVAETERALSLMKARHRATKAQSQQLWQAARAHKNAGRTAEARAALLEYKKKCLVLSNQEATISAMEMAMGAADQSQFNDVVMRGLGASERILRKSNRIKPEQVDALMSKLQGHVDDSTEVRQALSLPLQDETGADEDDLDALMAQLDGPSAPLPDVPSPPSGVVQMPEDDDDEDDDERVSLMHTVAVA